MQPLPQNDPFDGDVGHRALKQHHIWAVCMCVCVCVIWVAISALWLAAVFDERPVTSVDGFVCVGCGGTCRGGGDCDGCLCLMVPQQCANNGSDVECWEEAFDRELSVVPIRRAVCGTAAGTTMGCGLM